MRKDVFSSSRDRAVTGNPKAVGSNPVGRQRFALLVLRIRRSGISSLGFRAGSL